MSQQNFLLHPSLAIKSMRDNGYKTAAHAISEIIDNSIQAKSRSIEILCIDKLSNKQRRHKIVDKILILDDGIGMSPKNMQEAIRFGSGLHRQDLGGIGKFGMGLPSATISQCRKLDLYSWQNGECYHTYLDLDEIEAGDYDSVPEPTRRNIPTEYVKQLFREGYNSDSGTLVVWSDFDRLTWKTSKSIFTNSEKLIGRIYRHFIADKSVRIKFKSFFYDSKQGRYTSELNQLFRINDPLFLYSKNTILPELPGDYKNESFFEQYGQDEIIEVELDNGVKGNVIVKYSRVNKSIHTAIRNTGIQAVGESKYGKLAKYNQGISIVRANREINLVQLPIADDTRNRWFSIEVSFSPELDDLFRVTYDKQEVINFKPIDIHEEYESQKYDDETQADFQDRFEAEKSINYWIYKIYHSIQKNCKELFKYARNLTDDKNKKDTYDTHSESSEEARKQRQNRIEENLATKTDNEFEKIKIQPDEIKPKIVTTLVENGMDTNHAQNIIEQMLKDDSNVRVEEAVIRGNAFFDVIRESGIIIINLNIEHPFFAFYNSLNDHQKELVKLILIAWAQCEDKNESYRRQMEDIRAFWGNELDAYLHKLKD